MKPPKTHDTLDRRWRFASPQPDEANPRVRPVYPRARGLHAFETIHRHGGLLTTDAIHRFQSDRYPSIDGTRRMLKRFYHEKHTAHGGTYIYRPWQQTETVDPEKNMLVHGITPQAAEALKEAGLWRDHAPRPVPNQWKHSFFLSSLTSSIHLACLEKPDEYSYVFHDEIIDRIGVFEFPITYKYAKGTKEATRTLIPDRAFGIHYKKSGGARIFLVEADRGNERFRSDKLTDKSHEHNLLMYREFIGRGGYKKYFGQNTSIMLLTVFTDPNDMISVMNLSMEIFEGKSPNYMLYKAWPDFGRYFIPPKPRLDLLTEPWQLPGQPPFSIA